MEAQEQKLLIEIKGLYDKLQQNINGKYFGVTKIEEPGSGYKLHATKLLKKLQELYSSFHPDYLDESDIADFIHTIDREVSHVDYLYQETIKAKATRKKKLELEEAINKANNQIELDLYGLLKIIDEVKTS